MENQNKKSLFKHLFTTVTQRAHKTQVRVLEGADAGVICSEMV